MANNFKVWAEENGNLLPSDEFEAASKNGFKAGDLLSAQKINTILRQNSLMSAALEEWLAQHSQNIDIDTDMLDIAQSLGKSWKSQDIINVTIYEDMWQPIDKTDLGGAGKGYGGSMAYKYEILLDNFSPYDLYIIGAPSSIAQTSFSDGKASTRATSYDETYQFITFALATNIGITLYATEKPYTAIIPLHILYNINTNTVPGPCFLSHQPKNSQYLHESSYIVESTGYTAYTHHLCNHARMQREITIAPTETKFGRLDEICIDCTYHKSYFIIPTKTNNSPIFPNCKHNCTGFLSTGLFTHVEYCFDCCTLMAPEENHSIVWRSNENNHWSECDKCHNVISQEQAHKESTKFIPIPSKNESGHGKQCSICQHIIPSTVASHSASEDGKCSECGYTHDHEYTLPYGYSPDIANYHYLNAVCNICGKRREDYNNEDEKEDHQWIVKIYPKEESRNESYQHTCLVTCKICGVRNDSESKTEKHTWDIYDPEDSLMPINSRFHANICGVKSRNSKITAICCGTAHDELYNKMGVPELGKIKYCSKFGEEIVIEQTEDIPLRCEGELSSDKILNNKIIDTRKIPHRLAYKTNDYGSRQGCGFMANMAPHYVASIIFDEETNTYKSKCKCGYILSNCLHQKKDENDNIVSTIEYTGINADGKNDCTLYRCSLNCGLPVYTTHEWEEIEICGQPVKCKHPECEVTKMGEHPDGHSINANNIPCGESRTCEWCNSVVNATHNSHSFVSSYNSSKHGDQCEYCGQWDEKTVQSHNFKTQYIDDQKHLKYCQNCEYKSEGPHDNPNFGQYEQTYDDAGHIKIGCSCTKFYREYHNLKPVSQGNSGHKTQCTICKLSPPEANIETHTPDENGLQSTSSTHYYKCNVCNSIYNSQPHTLEAQENGPGSQFAHSIVCSTCSRVISSHVAHAGKTYLDKSTGYLCELGAE